MKQDFIRTFIAIEIPNEVKGEISEVLAKLESLPFSVKWVEPDNIHLTLSFLGYIEKSRLDNLSQAIEKGTIGVFPFVIKPSKIVCFPSFTQPRVIALGLKGEIFLLEKLQKQIKKSLFQSGFKAEGKKPHLTLGRVRQKVKRGDRRRLGRKLMDFSFDFEQEIKVNSVTVFRSDLFPQGPVYTKLKEFELSSNHSEL